MFIPFYQLIFCVTVHVHAKVTRERIFELFSQFGLLHSVKLFPAKFSNEGVQWAKVKFYSARAARRSLIQDGMTLQGISIRVSSLEFLADHVCSRCTWHLSQPNKLMHLAASLSYNKTHWRYLKP